MNCLRFAYPHQAIQRQSALISRRLMALRQPTFEVAAVRGFIGALSILQCPHTFRPKTARAGQSGAGKPREARHGRGSWSARGSTPVKRIRKDTHQ